MAANSNIRAGGAFVDLFTKDGALVAGLQRAALRVRAFGASVSAVGQRLASMGTMFALPLLGAAKLFADFGSDMLDMSQRTGLTVEALSELRFAAEQSGASVEDLEAAIRIMSRTVGSGGLSLDARLEQMADELASINDPAERAARAMEIFGRGGTRLLPLFADGAAGVRQLREEARRLGITMSTEDAQAAESFGDSMSALLAALKMAVFHVGGALGPALQEIAKLFTEGATATARWLQENAAIVKIVAIGVAGLTALGIALMLLGPAISAVGVGIGIVAAGIKLAIAAGAILIGMIGSLLTPLGLVLLSLDLLRGHMVVAAVQSTDALGTIERGFRDVADTAVETWGGISDAIAGGEWALAAQIAMTGLTIMWRQTVTTMRTLWNDFAAFFVDVFHEAVNTAAQFIVGLETGFMQSLFGGVLGQSMLDTGTQVSGTIAQDFREQQRERERQRLQAQQQANTSDQEELARLRRDLEVQLLEAQYARWRVDFERENNTRRRPPEVNLAEMAAKSQAIGTFSGFGLSGLGAGKNVVDRIANATERTARAAERFAQPAFT